MKNKIFIISVLLMVSILPAAAETVSVGSATVAPGGTATVAIQVSGITTDIAAATVRLTFNPAVVTVSSVSAGDLGSPAKNIDNIAGTVDITVFSTTPASAAPVTLANVVLQGASGAAQGATSPLTLTITALTDSNGVSRVPGAGGITNGIATIGGAVTGTVVTIQNALGSSSISGAANGVIPVSIAAKNVQNLGAATVTLTYDSSVVTVQNVSSGDMGSPVSNINNVAGTTQITTFTLTGKNGNVTLANLELKIVGSAGATSPLTLSVSTLADANGAPMAYTTSSGQLSVVAVARGDMNCDGAVNIIDALLIAQYSVGLRSTPYTC